MSNQDNLRQISSELAELDIELEEPDEDCPYGLCDGSGVILPDPIGSGPAEDCKCSEPDEEEKQRQEKQRRRRILRERFKNAELPKRFRDKSLDDFDDSDNPEALKVARRFIDVWPDQLESGSGIYFHGPSSTGKSHLAYSIGKEIMRQGYGDVLIMPASRMIRELKPNNPEEDRKHREEMLFSVDLLVLDDVGRSRTTEWVTEQIMDIVDERYLEMKPTIFTSNYSIDELAGFEKDCPGWVPLAERIREMTAKSVEMTGKSYRQEGDR